MGVDKNKTLNDIGITDYFISTKDISSVMMEISKKYETLLSSIGSTTIDSIERSLKYYTEFYNKNIAVYEETIVKNFSMITNISNINIGNINTILKNDYSEVFKKIGEYAILFNNIYGNKSDTAINDDATQDIKEELHLSESENESDTLSEEEIREAFCEQIENPIGFQERIANWVEEKKKKYFLVYGFNGFDF